SGAARVASESSAWGGRRSRYDFNPVRPRCESSNRFLMIFPVVFQGRRGIMICGVISSHLTTRRGAMLYRTSAFALVALLAVGQVHADTKDLTGSLKSGTVEL